MTQTQSILQIPRPSRLVQYVHSRLRPFDIEIDTVRDVLNHYGLELVKPPRNLPIGRRSRNVVVDTSVGRKVLKRYRPEWQIPTIIYGHSILTHLAELNFPAPRLVTASDSGTFVSRDGQNYALFDYVGGTNYSSRYLRRTYRLKLLALAGQTLARFHRQLEGFVPKGRHHLGFKSYTEDRQHDLDWYVEQLNELKADWRCLAESEKKVRVNWMTQTADLMLEELHRLDEELKAAALPRRVIHGDYATPNLLFQRDGTVIPMDLELARLEWRLSDLVTSLARFRRNDGGLDFEAMRCFVAAYEAESPIGTDEWRHLPRVWRFRRIQRALLSWKSYLEADGTAQSLASAREAVTQSNWALHHQDELLALNPAYLRPRG